MNNPKRGFLLYFDNYPMVTMLPPEQRGWLLTALFSYADKIWRDMSLSIEDVLDTYPELSDEGRVAFSFLASNIRRDTFRWLSRRESRSQRRRQQEESLPTSTSTPEELQREAELFQRDIERTRQLLEQYRQENH